MGRETILGPFNNTCEFPGAAWMTNVVQIIYCMHLYREDGDDHAIAQF